MAWLTATHIKQLLRSPTHPFGKGFEGASTGVGAIMHIGRFWADCPAPFGQKRFSIVGVVRFLLTASRRGRIYHSP